MLDWTTGCGALAVPDCGAYIGQMPSNLAPDDHPTLRSDAVAWVVSPQPVGYLEAVRVMEARADRIVRGEADEPV